MQAIVYRSYGPPDVLGCEEVEKPAVGDGQVLVRVRAASVNPLDWHFMRGTPYPIRAMTGLRRPKLERLGVDVAGHVEAVGRDVSDLAPGDAVFGSCRGAFAEYACATASSLVKKPGEVTFEQAASVPVAALTALQALRDTGRLQPRQKVLVNGASGGVGTFAVQIAKALGADVTGVCSAANVEMVRSIGADHVIDYTREDFSRSGRVFDVILDAVGNRALSDCRRVLGPTGTYVVVAGANGRWIGPLLPTLKTRALSPFVGHRLVAMLARIRGQDLATLSELMAPGKLKPVIDRRYGLTEVPEAIRYLEAGHARGKVVISVEA
jgi:NADPH:quinone reductase-like Zn-dependent oxidoreductase